MSDRNDQIFRFNLASTTQSNQFIRVKDGGAPDASFLSGREFTIAAWIYWAGNAADKPWATILAKGQPATDTYGLYIDQDGKIQFQIYRNVHEKQWYCWFGKWCDDDAAADKAYRKSTYLITAKSVIPKQIWTHVAATFGGETMRIFVNGQKVAELSTTETWGGGAGEYRHQTTTISLAANQDPLLIGRQAINTVPDWPFRGMMDHIQFYVRMLGIEEVAQVYRLGICRGK